MLTTNLFKFQQNKFKIRSSTLFNLDLNNDRPKFSKFQHLLHNKPAKIDHNLISFQTVFTLDKKFLSTKFFNDSLTFNSYDVCSRSFNAKLIQKLQQQHKLSIY